MSNVEQVNYWNGPEGALWVTRENQFDAMLAPFVAPILGAAALAAADRVLDVGCGNGATSRAAAAQVPSGSVLGVDISGPMLERARSRAAEAGLTNVEYLQADAQTQAFAPEFDVIVSRYGVMFFDDPLAAFTNLAGALRTGGRLAFVCWQDLMANEWVAVPGGAMVPIVGIPEAAPPDAPGPFAFADRDRVAAILTDAGFSGVEIDDLHEPVLLGGGLDVDAATAFLVEGGMGQRFLAGAEPEQVELAIAAVKEAFSAFATPEGVRLGSAAWLVKARV